jgi:hypothetical protein
MKIHPVGTEFFHADGQMYRRADVRANVPFLAVMRNNVKGHSAVCMCKKMCIESQSIKKNSKDMGAEENWTDAVSYFEFNAVQMFYQGL